jgi:DNA-binding beta-propeller fold protein YncE
VGDLGAFRAQVFDESGAFQFAEPSPPSPPPVGGFNGPRGVAFDPSGDMFVTDTYNERIEEFQPNASGGYTFYQQWGMRGDIPSSFNYPRLECWDPLTALKGGGHGALIVANTQSNEITAWDPTSSPPSVLWASVNPTTHKGTLAGPYGVACDPSTGQVYAANTGAGDLVVFDPSGNQLGTIGAGTISGIPRGIWVDSLDGSVWVDVPSPTATAYHFASWASGGGLESSFAPPAGSGPYGIAGDSVHLYVALSAWSEVAEYTRSGALIGTFGGHGKAIGQMATPQGLAFAPDGKLYVVEENNNRVSQWSVPATG